jgi:hypothetical protein
MTFQLVPRDFIGNQSNTKIPKIKERQKNMSACDVIMTFQLVPRDFIGNQLNTNTTKNKRETEKQVCV